ncbi:H-NS family nucleoid-associated regulatory protein [Paraburkholderia sacchari]|uniref:H-NS family nucleoid-associated regulatory protein n=1 Tax=Paraburkholderia sacchari TaxID=159450 RepID=UPI0005419904|nr:H-NS family nucleoid-associated regulatory protein [Paraburkholderia sacchari]NLP60244.1 H-NS histone family protein [Paraburkholderia sacchari]
MDERKRESIVAYLRRRMAEFGIEPQDIASSIAADQERMRSVRYRDAFGHTWDGEGAPPQWVVQATSAGQSLEHFSINGKPTQESAKRDGVDWRNDPFAGTRLATQKAERLGVA